LSVDGAKTMKLKKKKGAITSGQGRLGVSTNSSDEALRHKKTGKKMPTRITQGSIISLMVILPTTVSGTSEYLMGCDSSRGGRRGNRGITLSRSTGSQHRGETERKHQKKARNASIISA